MFPSRQNSSLNLKEKTEKALKAVNQYEKMKQTFLNTHMNSITQFSSPFDGYAIRDFEPNQQVKSQILPNYLVYYKVNVSVRLEPKLIIRNFKGGPVEIYIYFDRMFKQLEKASHFVVVKDEIILKLNKKSTQESKKIYVVLKNSNNLTSFSFRIDSEKERKMYLKTDRSQLSISIEIEKTLEGQVPKKQQQQNEEKQKRSKSPQQKSKNLAKDTQNLLCLRPEQKLKKIAQLKSLQLEKKQAAKKRMENLLLFKEKNSQAMKVSSQCKKQFTVYQDLVKNQEKRKRQLLQKTLPFFYAMKYCLLSSMFFNEREKNLKRMITVKSYQKKFTRQIRSAYRETKQMQPDKARRQSQVFSQIQQFLNATLSQISRKKSIEAIVSCLQSCYSGVLINLAMNQSSMYRRVVRGVQKRWKSRFQARTSMLLQYSQDQLIILLKAYPNLSYVEKQYRESNSVYRLCIEYQKEIANKFKDQLQTYKRRISEIKEYEKINEQIIEFNSKALKKRQKQLLQIPKKPAYPQFRFFRDLLFLKALVRGELEVMFRKFKKKNFQLFPKLPDQSPNKFSKKNIK